MRKDTDSVEILKTIFERLNEDSVMEDVSIITKQHLQSIETEHSLAKMMMTSFCQDGLFFELIIELIGDAIGEMMMFDLNVINFDDVIRNCSSLVPINLISWNNLNSIYFMQKVSQHYLIQFRIVRLNNSPDSSTK